MDPFSSRKSAVQTRRVNLINSINKESLGIIRANNIINNLRESNLFWNNIRNEFMVALNLASFHMVEGIQNHAFTDDSEYIWGIPETRMSGLRLDLFQKKQFFHRTWLDAFFREVIDVPGNKPRKAGTLKLPIATEVVSLIRGDPNGVLMNNIRLNNVRKPIVCSDVIADHIVTDLLKNINNILFENRKNFQGNFILFIMPPLKNYFIFIHQFNFFSGLLKKFTSCYYKIIQNNASLISSIFSSTKEAMMEEAKKLFLSKLNKDAMRKGRHLEELRSNAATLPAAIATIVAEIRVLENLIKDPIKNFFYFSNYLHIIIKLKSVV